MGRDFQNICLPYCLKQAGDGYFWVLNRWYKPVGFTTSNWVEYEDYPVAIRFKSFTPATASRISHSGSTDTWLIYLYCDICTPRRSHAFSTEYFKRLQILSKLKLRTCLSDPRGKLRRLRDNCDPNDPFSPAAQVEHAVHTQPRCLSLRRTLSNN